MEINKRGKVINNGMRRINPIKFINKAKRSKKKNISG
jgi:hypothetical protein